MECSSFRRFDLEILQYSYHPYSEDDADCELIIELSTIIGDTLPDSASLKINLYNDEGEIFLNEEYYISSESFFSYDTFKISLYDNAKTLITAKSARIYMSQS